MKAWFELTFYIAVSAGMALSTSSFTVLSALFQVAGGVWAVAAVLVAGVICLALSLSIAELASMFPSAPAVRTYFKAAFHDRSSLFLVYLYLIFLVVIADLESYVFALVLQHVVPWAPPLAIVLTLIAAVVTTNLLGLDLSRGMQIVTAFFAIAIIGATGAFTLVSGAGGAQGVLTPGTGAGALQLPAAAGLAVFLYMGFEWVTPLGFGPQAYARRIPIAMPIAILILMVSYAMFTAGMALFVPRETLASTPVPQLVFFRTLAGNAGGYLAAALSLAAIISTFNAGLMGGSQLIYALGREGVLPRWCASMIVRTGSPVGAVLLLGLATICSSLAVLLLRLEDAVSLVGAAVICFIYAAYVRSVIRLRRSAPDRKRPYRSPLPVAAQRLLAAMLLVLGVQSLLSHPDLTYSPLAGALGAVALAWLVARWSAAHAARGARASRVRQASSPSV